MMSDIEQLTAAHEQWEQQCSASSAPDTRTLRPVHDYQ